MQRSTTSFFFLSLFLQAQISRAADWLCLWACVCLLAHSPFALLEIFLKAEALYQ